MEKTLPKAVSIPIGITMALTGAMMLLMGIGLAIGQGNITYVAKK